MKKIGIITFHKAHNYGAMLQVFALSKKLSHKYDVEIIDYYNRKIYDEYKVIRPLKKNLFKSAKRLIHDILFFKLDLARYKSFNYFINSKCKLSNKCSKKNWKKNLGFYDVLITGSDQVWNKNIVGELSDIYTLNFITENKCKKISYAASIGQVSLISDNKEEYKDKISKIDYISVRETDAKEELKKIIDKNITEVLDPTILLTQDDWNKEIDSIKITDENYIFAYVVEPDNEYIKIVNDLSKKTGLSVIHCGIKNPGYINVKKSIYTKGPLDFIFYIKQANYIVTTSFHATVFSIIFQKKFFVIPHRTTGNRVTNLLKKFNINGRIYNSYDEFNGIDYNFETNWKKVNKIIDQERIKSYNWLNNAIEDGSDYNE